MTELEIRRWRSVIEEITNLVLGFPERENNPWLKNYPHSSCDVMSFAVGATLLQRYGEEWHIVSYLADADFTAHTWLTLEKNGSTYAWIDPTIRQFQGFAHEPFYGFGSSPALRSFSSQLGPPLPISKITNDWHNQGTQEIYEWLFSELEIYHF